MGFGLGLGLGFGLGLGLGLGFAVAYLSTDELEGEHTSTRAAIGPSAIAPPGFRCATSRLRNSMSVRVLPVPKGPTSRKGALPCMRVVSCAMTRLARVRVGGRS